MNTTTTTTTAAAKRSSTLYMVELAMMIAIILLMSFTPLGYLRTPGLSITLLTIPVAVGAIILGPKGGAVCGLAFGATSFYMAVTGSSAFAAALFNINPFWHFYCMYRGTLCWKDGSQDLFSQHYINHRRRNFPITLLHWHARY